MPARSSPWSDAALEKTKGIARGLNGRLALGITSSDAFHPQILACCSEVPTTLPGGNAASNRGQYGDADGGAWRSGAGYCFCRLPCESSKAFNLRIIDQEPMVIALARSHPLSSCDELALEQLTDVAPILFRAKWAPGQGELVFNSYLRAGIDVQRAYQSSQISSSLSMVEAGFGFALVPQSMTASRYPGVSTTFGGRAAKTDIVIALGDATSVRAR